MKKNQLIRLSIISVIFLYTIGAYAAPLKLAGSSTFFDQAFDDSRDIFTISNESDLGNKQPRPEDVVLVKPPERGRKLAPIGGKLELSPGFF